MTSWKINPSGAQSILKGVSAEQEGLSGLLAEGEFEAVFTGISGAGGLVAEVPKALQSLMENQKSNLQAVMNSVAAGVNGVSNSVISYNRGQEEMAGEFQRQMSASAVSGDFSFFEQHGYKGEGV